MPRELLQVLWNAPIRCALLALKGIGDLIDYGQHQLGKELIQSCAETVLARKTPELTSHWHTIAGTLATYEGHPEEAVRLLSIALKAAKDAAYQEGIARSLLAVAVQMRVSDGPMLDAEKLLREALEQEFTKSNPNVLSRVLLNLSMVQVRKGQADEADELLVKANRSIRESGNPILEGWLLKYNGFLARLRCNFPAAAQRFSSASEVFFRLGNSEEAERCRDLGKRSILTGDAGQVFAQANKSLQELVDKANRNGQSEMPGVNQAIVQVSDALGAVDLSCVSAQEQVSAVMKGPLLWLELLVEDRKPLLGVAAPKSLLREPILVKTREGRKEIVARNQTLPVDTNYHLQVVNGAGVDIEFYYGNEPLGHILLTELPASVRVGATVSLYVSIAEDLSMRARVEILGHACLGDLKIQLPKSPSNELEALTPTRDEMSKALIETREMLGSAEKVDPSLKRQELGKLLDRMSLESDHAHRAGDQRKWGEAAAWLLELRGRLESALRATTLDQLPAPILLGHAHQWLADLERSGKVSGRALNPETHELLERVRRELNSVEVDAPDAKLQIIQILQRSYLQLEILVSDPAPPSSISRLT